MKRNDLEFDAEALAAPDSGLLDRVRDFLRRFPQVEGGGLAFPRAEIPEVKPSKLTPCGLEFLWEDKPDIYSARIWELQRKAVIGD